MGSPVLELSRAPHSRVGFQPGIRIIHLYSEGLRGLRNFEGAERRGEHDSGLWIDLWDCWRHDCVVLRLRCCYTASMAASAMIEDTACINCALNEV
jgi:hypothetical protein